LKESEESVADTSTGRLQ